MPSAAWAPSPRRWRKPPPQRRRHPRSQPRAPGPRRGGRAVGVRRKWESDPRPRPSSAISTPSCSIRGRSSRPTCRRTSSSASRVPLRLGHIPHERGAVGAAGLHRLPGRAAADHRTAGIILAPTLGYMERRTSTPALSAGPAQPIVELLIPSTLDDSLAPPGSTWRACSASTSRRSCPMALLGCHREKVADLMIETVDASRAELQGLGARPSDLTPLDLERTFGLIGGDIFHGALSWIRCSRPADAGLRRLSRSDARASTCAARAPIPAAASPARRATTPRAKFSPISGGANCAGRADRPLYWWSRGIFSCHVLEMTSLPSRISVRMELIVEVAHVAADRETAVPG